MTAWTAAADELLRVGGRSGEGIVARDPMGRVLILFVGCGLLYGAVMGCYDGGVDVRPLQAFYSAIKVPLLFAASFAISLPSFFVLNTLAGVRGDFPEALRALMKTQAGIALILASLAPLTAVWYLSSTDYRLAKIFNLAMFALASLAGQWLLRRRYAALLQRNAVHRSLVRAWLVIYAFVGVQMAWIGRPFIGAPGMETRLLREGAWSNAYVHLAKVIWQTLGG
ncbi:MAG: hypothetical protein AAF961_18380 [Planctomycetota bacterium]